MTVLDTHMFFLPRPDGQRLCVYHPPAPASPARPAVVYLHPFAEEMNKSRRMAAIQSRRLAASGHAVLQIDLKGCGDSSGDFGDARWRDWVDDALAAAQWLLQCHPGPLCWWGLRVGALLAVQAAAERAQGDDLLLWQPVVNGASALQQFLRLKLAAGLADGTGREAMAEARAELNRGGSVEIAGYCLASDLAQGLEQARLDAARGIGRVTWLEVASRADATLAPAARSAATAMQSAGATVHSAVVPGPAFWQSVEIELAPALWDATDAGLASTGGDRPDAL